MRDIGNAVHAYIGYQMALPAETSKALGSGELSACRFALSWECRLDFVRGSMSQQTAEHHG